MSLATTGKRQEYGLDSNMPMLRSQTRILDEQQERAMRKCAEDAAKVYAGPCGTCAQSAWHADGCQAAAAALTDLLDEVLGLKVGEKP